MRHLTKENMKLNGLTVFSLILGTFSLSLDRNKRQADLTETAATLPSADIARCYAGSDPVPNFTASSSETYSTQVQKTVDNRRKRNSPHSSEESVHPEADPQQNHNSEDEQADVNAITTVKPQPPPSYFARYLTRSNAGQHDSEEKNEDSKNLSSPQDLSNLYCTERTSADESSKKNGNESKNFTETNLSEIAEHEETTDTTQYENTQERSVDKAEVESSGQVLDTDNPTRFHLDLESMLLDTIKSKRESPLNQSTLEDETTTPQLDVSELDYPDEQLVTYDYYELRAQNSSNPSYILRLIYWISYLYSAFRRAPSSVSNMVSKFFH